MSEENQEVDLPEDVIADLRSKHGELIAFNVEPFGTFVFHRMSKAANDMMINKLADQFEKAQAIQEGVMTCLCYPVLGDGGKPDYKVLRQFFSLNPNASQELLAEIRDLPASLNIKKL